MPLTIGTDLKSATVGAAPDRVENPCGDARNHVLLAYPKPIRSQKFTSQLAPNRARARRHAGGGEQS
jgi:hypothetical protein